MERCWEAVPDSVNYLRKGCCVALVELCFFTEGNPTQRKQRTQNPAIFLKTKRTKLTKILMSILTSSSVRIRANNISSHLSGQFLFSFCLNKTTCPIFFPLRLPVKHVVMSVARDTLLNLRIQTVVTFLERRGKDKDSGDSNVGANLERLLKAGRFF